MYCRGAAVRYFKFGLAWVLDSQTWVLASLSLYYYYGAGTVKSTKGSSFPRTDHMYVPMYLSP